MSVSGAFNMVQQTAVHYRHHVLTTAQMHMLLDCVQHLICMYATVKSHLEVSVKLTVALLRHIGMHKTGCSGETGLACTYLAHHELENS